MNHKKTHTDKNRESKDDAPLRAWNKYFSLSYISFISFICWKIQSKMCEPIWKWLYSDNHHFVMDSSLCSLLSVSLSHWRMLFTRHVSCTCCVAFILSYHVLPTCLTPNWVCPIGRADVSPVMDDGFFSEHHWWQTFTLVSYIPLCTHISIVSLIAPSFLSIRSQCFHLLEYVGTLSRQTVPSTALTFDV